MAWIPRCCGCGRPAAAALIGPLAREPPQTKKKKKKKIKKKKKKEKFLK